MSTASDTGADPMLLVERLLKQEREQSRTALAQAHAEGEQRRVLALLDAEKRFQAADIEAQRRFVDLRERYERLQVEHRALKKSCRAAFGTLAALCATDE